MGLHGLLQGLLYLFLFKLEVKVKGKVITVQAVEALRVARG
jgi:hypothetical protein